MTQSIASEMHAKQPKVADEDSFREFCHGVVPLDARVEPWMTKVLTGDHAERVVEQHGSPVNLVNDDPFVRNIRSLNEVAVDAGIDFEVFFARKSNKCLAFVDAVRSLRCGIDTASEEELSQVLEREIESDKIICTAAIKSSRLVEKCIRSNVVIAIDNIDELLLTKQLAGLLGRRARIALRISGFDHGTTRLFSRFGIDIHNARSVVAEHLINASDSVFLEGVHFHLDGYCPYQRISAISQCIDLIDDLRTIDLKVKFLDMGGGFPMSYLDDGSQYEQFWHEHRAALLGSRSEITYRNHGLGLTNVNQQIVGKPNCYPYYQKPTKQKWLQTVLTSEKRGEGPSSSIAAAIRSRNLQLRCEPGRSVLDGCGMTIARVEFCKRHPDGYDLVGLAMNHTQCKASSDDFLVDPLVVRKIDDRLLGVKTHIATEGYLVGAYCTESELLLQRKMVFPSGIARGDLVVFPNTAGYLMHFRESRSHQFPLAMNLIAQSDESAGLQFTIDSIDTVDV